MRRPSRAGRERFLSPSEAATALTAFDAWTGQNASAAKTASEDIAAAARMIRRLDLPLRAPDAIHIAIAQRLESDLFTFDRRMAASARLLGTNAIPA